MEDGLPSLEEARKLVMAQIQEAKRAGVRVLKVIHGYGSSGKGGKLCIGLRKSFALRKKEGVIREFIAGEDFALNHHIGQCGDARCLTCICDLDRRLRSALRGMPAMAL